MRVLIIGASRGIGLETTRQALDADYDVRALARSEATIGITNSRLEKVNGDALAGVDAVIMTLGVGLGELFRPIHLFSKATRVLIGAMEAQNVKRLICVTGFGADDSRASINCLQRVPFQIVFGHAYEDKSRQEPTIKEIALYWTIARPGVLTGGPRTGRYRVLCEPSRWQNGIIPRADVADFLVRQIGELTCVHEAPVLIG